jgi:hypothetical protein
MTGRPPEQKFCGEWWDCDDARCLNSTLIPSDGMKKQWAGMGYTMPESSPQNVRVMATPLAGADVETGGER